MHLVFHAGHHKTGTTTFQGVLTTLREQLLEYDIYVPVIGGTANMGPSVVHPAQRGDWSGYDAVLRDARSALTSEGVLLFSAEDLENCLFDPSFGEQFMVRARSQGVRSVRWVFVQRNEFEYFESLYGELCKHRQVLRYDLLADEILKRGFFSCATPQFRWYFVFRYENALRRFRKRVCDDVIRLAFPDFTRSGVGSAVFDVFRKGDEYRALASATPVDPQNVRFTDDAVERHYVATFLMLDDAGLPNATAALNIDALVTRRLELRSRCRAAVRKRFETVFHAVPQTFDVASSC